MSYLDDLLIVADSLSLLVEQCQVLLQLCKDLRLSSVGRNQISS